MSKKNITYTRCQKCLGYHVCSVVKKLLPDIYECRKYRDRDERDDK